MNLINERALKERLDSECQSLNVIEQIGSTNQAIKEQLVSKEKPAVCIALKQTKGRGRNKKEWVSDRAGNLYFSYKYLSYQPFEQLGLLSLRVGVWLVELLSEQYNIKGLQLKWPNDLYARNKKLSGILIETSTRGNCTEVIIGIGLNCVEDKREITKDWCSLEELCDEPPNLIDLSARLINKLTLCLVKQQVESSHEFFKKWETLDYLKGKKCTIVNSEETFNGVATGLSKKGGLVLRQACGQERVFYAGELHFDKGEES